MASSPSPAWGHVAERGHHGAPAPPAAPSPPVGLGGGLGLPQSLSSIHTNAFLKCLFSDVLASQEMPMSVLTAEGASSCSCGSSNRALYLHPSLLIPRSLVPPVLAACGRLTAVWRWLWTHSYGSGSLPAPLCLHGCWLLVMEDGFFTSTRAGTHCTQSVSKHRNVSEILSELSELFPQLCSSR